MFSRITRLAIGVAVVTAAAAAVPMAAQAQDSALGGTLTGGALVAAPPTITPFGVTLTGVSQSVSTNVSAWHVTDPTGTNDGYTTTVAASVPEVGGSVGAAGTDGSITMTPVTATAGTGNTATTAPTAAGAQLLTTVPATIQAAAANTGQGEWDFAAAATGLTVVIPSDASAGAYTSTLTFTTAPLA
jgi:hypothetical protein